METNGVFTILHWLIDWFFSKEQTEWINQKQALEMIKKAPMSQTQ